MNRIKSLVFALGLLSLTSCRSRSARNEQDKTVPIPPGYCCTNRADAQAEVDRENADLDRMRAEQKRGGIRDADLPCGRYKVISTHDADGHEFWGTQRDMTGCPGSESLPSPQGRPKTGGHQP